MYYLYDLEKSIYFNVLICKIKGSLKIAYSTGRELCLIHSTLKILAFIINKYKLKLCNAYIQLTWNGLRHIQVTEQ